MRVSLHFARSTRFRFSGAILMCVTTADADSNTRLVLRRCGKLVVAQDESELAGLDELLRRAHANGVELHKISAAEARTIEPRARTHVSALWSPSTKSASPALVAAALLRTLEASGTTVLTDAPFAHAHWNGHAFRLDAGGHRLECKHVVNCAGLYADRVAHAFGFARDFTLLPFKGLYLYCRPDVQLRTHIYPVPNLATPFLGTHTTLSIDGTSKIGPTAIPALWRQHYDGLQHFSASECAEIASQLAGLGARSVWAHARRAISPSATKPDFGEQFLSLAWHEIQKYRRANLVRGAANLVHTL